MTATMLVAGAKRRSAIREAFCAAERDFIAELWSDPLVPIEEIGRLLGRQRSSVGYCARELLGLPNRTLLRWRAVKERVASYGQRAVEVRDVREVADASHAMEEYQTMGGVSLAKLKQ